MALAWRETEAPSVKSFALAPGIQCTGPYSVCTGPYSVCMGPYSVSIRGFRVGCGVSVWVEGLDGLELGSEWVRVRV